MDPLNYGKLIRTFNNVYNLQLNDKNDVFITQFDNHNEVEFYRSGNLVYKWIDKWLNDETFSRLIGRKEFIFKNNKQLLVRIEKPSKFLSNLNRENEITNKFITMDIETFIKDGIHIPYCISWFDGENTFFYYLTDYKDSNSMIINCIHELMIKKYDNYKVYIHNLARFDSIFLLKILANLGYVKPIIHNNKIISITFGLNGYIVQFRDSKQILLNPLRDLGKSFGVKVQKSVFPYTFVNENNFNYNAWLPEFKERREGKLHSYNLEFNKLSLFDNLDLLNQFVQYAKQDSISLLKALLKAQLIYIKEHEVDIASVWSTSTLSLKIFRQEFLKTDIPILTNKLDEIIRLSYIGGSTDYYIKYGEGLKHYDVNSLYPKAMCNPMPLKFLGETIGSTVKLEDIFGFAEVRIITPDDIPIPLLPFKVDNETLHPLGSWIGIYFSEELKTIVKYGYKVELIKVYNFSKANIFNEYIKFFYNIKKKTQLVV